MAAVSEKAIHIPSSIKNNVRASILKEMLLSILGRIRIMLCNECGKNQATVHSVQYVNGAKSEVHLCSQCAKHHPELSMNLFSTEIFSRASLTTLCRCPCTLARARFVTPAVPVLGVQAERVVRLPGLLRYLQRRRYSGAKGDAWQHSAYRRKACGKCGRGGKAPPLLRFKGTAFKAVAEERFEDAAKLRDEIGALKMEEK